MRSIHLHETRFVRSSPVPLRVSRVSRLEVPESSHFALEERVLHLEAGFGMRSEPFWCHGDLEMLQPRERKKMTASQRIPCGLRNGYLVEDRVYLDLFRRKSNMSIWSTREWKVSGGSDYCVSLQAACNKSFYVAIA